jgi:RNA polymerase sigma factor (sigma-70 family)
MGVCYGWYYYFMESKTNLDTETAFLQNVNLHKGIIYKIAKVYASSTEDQDDLMQDMIAQLWKSFGAFREESTFKTWMYRVCLNTALTHVKRSVKKKIWKTDNALPDIPQEDKSDAVEKKEVMYKLIQALDDIDKALILSYLEGFSGEEIARNMGFTEANVRVRLLRIKQKLKHKIDRYGYKF